MCLVRCCVSDFFFQAEDGIRDLTVTGVQTCALPISSAPSCCQKAFCGERDEGQVAAHVVHGAAPALLERLTAPLAQPTSTRPRLHDRLEIGRRLPRLAHAAGPTEWPRARAARAPTWSRASASDTRDVDQVLLCATRLARTDPAPPAYPRRESIDSPASPTVRACERISKHDDIAQRSDLGADGREAEPLPTHAVRAEAVMQIPLERHAPPARSGPR